MQVYLVPSVHLSGKSAVSNNLWLDSGNVGIGTTTPTEKLEVNGNAVFSGNLTVDSVQVQQQMDVSGIPAGVYVLRLTYNQSIETIKLIVQ